MNEKKLIVLSGFMGCGKTTHGKKLAKLINYHFIDLDDYIESETGLDVTDLFVEKGEQEFRKIESDSLKTILNQNQKTVVALGGGTPCFNNNIDVIKQYGFLVYIKMSSDSLYNRLHNPSNKRPLIADKRDEELTNYINDLLFKREAFYNQANLIIDGAYLNETALHQAILEHTTI